ncbi:MAG: periplasmic heavy metal sensor [Armatimonadota bacterium]
MNRNRLVILVGIVLLAGALIFSWAAQQSPTAGGSCCGSSCTVKAVSSAPVNDTPGTACCGASCSCPMMQGAGKEIHDAYMNETAGLRKDLAEARAELDTLLSATPVDKEAVSKQVEKINGLQSELFTKTVDMWVAVHEQFPDGKTCENCKGPVACCMMMSDQCPKMLCKDKPGCAKGMGCGKASVKPAASETTECGPNGCPIVRNGKTSK